MSYILFLPSWYPDQEWPLNGNFIQRHAEIVAQKRKVIVLYIRSSPIADDFQTNQVNDNLAEYRIHFKSPTLTFLKPLVYIRAYLKAYKQITLKYGAPKIIHAHVAWFAGIFAYILSRVHHIPYIISEHWSGILPQNIDQLGFIKRTLLSFIYKKSAANTAVSKHLAAAVSKFSTKETMVISNVVDDVFVQAPQVEKFSKFTYIHISNFAPVKRSTEILQAYIQARKEGLDARLIMLGEENHDKERCRKISAESHYHLDIEILPQTSKEEIAKLMNQSHALVGFSEFETQGITILESLALGNPAITGNIEPFKEYMKANWGILVNNREELTQAFHQCRENFNNYDRDGMKSYISKNHIGKTIASNFENLYTKFD